MPHPESLDTYSRPLRSSEQESSPCPPPPPPPPPCAGFGKACFVPHHLDITVAGYGRAGHGCGRAGPDACLLCSGIGKEEISSSPFPSLSPSPLVDGRVGPKQSQESRKAVLAPHLWQH